MSKHHEMRAIRARHNGAIGVTHKLRRGRAGRPYAASPADVDGITLPIPGTAQAPLTGPSTTRPAFHAADRRRRGTGEMQPVE